MRLIGLDFETSGSDIEKGAVPIQLGLAWIDDNGVVNSHALYISGWDFKQGPETWSEEAAEVHKLTIEMIQREGEPAWKADIRLAAWLLDALDRDRMWNIPVGWNVAGFDMRFLHRWFPNLSRLISYRSIDLNALCLAYSLNEKGYKALKREAKDYASENVIGAGQDWHDAEFDAEAALHSLTYLSRRFHIVEEEG